MTTDVHLPESKPMEPKPASRRATAEGMAAKQRDISVSEFFTKNRHLLGFDNPQKALLTAVKEAVDNSLDACEEAGIIPTIHVAIDELAENRFRVTVQDNGPGIVRAQIPKIFAKLLYGSKFHRLKQSRGQQGIGISAAGMYGQLTTGRPIVVTSKTGKNKPAHRLEVRIDARTNAPEILKDDVTEWEGVEHGTKVSIEMAGIYRGGRASVATYLEQTVVANPHLELTFVPPRGAETQSWPRASQQLPPEVQEIKPHPYGVELGMLIKAFREASGRTAKAVLMEDFSRVSSASAGHLLELAGVPARADAAGLEGAQIESIHSVIQVSQAAIPAVPRLFKHLQKRTDKFSTAIMELGSNFTQGLIERVAKKAGFESSTPSIKVELSQLERFRKALEGQQVRIPSPPATCVAPIGEDLIVEGLKRRFHAEFYASHTRPPAVYRGNPFVVEVGIAFGGELPGDQSCEMLRFANRVPLLYQPRACATTEAVMRVNWKSYAKYGGINQRGSEMPVGPLAIMVHLASVWVPFTNEAKEAIANYEEIIEEIRAALQECGRKLGAYVNAKEAERWQHERKNLFERYIAEIAQAIQGITGVPAEKVKKDFHAALPNHVKLVADAPPSELPPGPVAGATDSVPPPIDATLEAAAVPVETFDHAAKPERAARVAIPPPPKAAAPSKRASAGGSKGEQLTLGGIAKVDTRSRDVPSARKQPKQPKQKPTKSRRS